MAKDLIACPVCDLLHRETDIAMGATARCHRCGTVLFAPRNGAMTQILMLSLTALVLMFAAIFFPFLEIDSHGLHSRSSIFDAVLAFDHGLLLPLSVAVAGLIVLLPLARLSAAIYVLGPMAIGYRPLPHADLALRFFDAARPWAMAEIFIVGVTVALVKIAGLAHVTLGPAFWAFAGLVLLIVLKDNLMCRMTIWKTLSERSRS